MEKMVALINDLCKHSMHESDNLTKLKDYI